METSLHAHDPLILQLSYNQSSFMAGNSRDREVWDIMVIDEDGIFDLLSQLPQSRAQNNGNIDLIFTDDTLNI